MGSKRKWMAQGAFLLLVMIGTAYGLLRGSDLGALLGALRAVHVRYWGTSLIFVIGFVLLESVILRYVFCRLGQGAKMSHCCLYSFVGFFFSCITPSAGGGQPAQVYFMHRDGIPAAASIPVLMLVTITYKLVLVIYGLVVLVFRPTAVMGALDGLWWWFYLGFGANLLFVGIYIGLLIWPKATERMLLWCLRCIPAKKR